MRRLANWPGQSSDVAEYVRACELIEVEHVGPCGLLNPLLLLTQDSKWGGVIGVDWLMGSTLTVQGFDQIHVHVDY